MSGNTVNLSIPSLLERKQAFIFELDDVLYPEKDYLLQVYYLFAQFIEYGEQINASELVTYMQQVYYAEGDAVVFEKVSAQFNIPEKYKLNFDLLMQNAKLPLKLLLFNEVLRFLQEIVVERKQIFVFTNGQPAMQLNKIRQVEWNGLETYLKVYFAVETRPKPSAKGIFTILDEHGISKSEALLIGGTQTDEACANNAGIEFLHVNKLLLT